MPMIINSCWRLPVKWIFTFMYHYDYFKINLHTGNPYLPYTLNIFILKRKNGLQKNFKPFFISEALVTLILFRTLLLLCMCVRMHLLFYGVRY